MALYVIAEVLPVNSDEQDVIHQLSCDLYDAEEATLKFAEFYKYGLLIDFDKCIPR